MSEDHEARAFWEDYRVTHCLNILKAILLKDNDDLVNKAVYETCLAAIKFKLEQTSEDKFYNVGKPIMNHIMWKILKFCKPWCAGSPVIEGESIAKLRSPKKKPVARLPGEKIIPKPKPNERVRPKRFRGKTLDEYEFSTITITDEMKDEIKVILDSFKTINPIQWGLNGNPGKNIWIIKPAGKSRGRGIKCMNDEQEILEYTTRAESAWIVQKYIENPLIVERKKFDIRQWVIVSNTEPLTVWFYSECYVRFCGADYDENNLKNKIIHLSNNSIQKKGKNFKTADIEGLMWHSDQFAEYFKETTGSDDPWFKKIQPGMKEAVKSSMISVQNILSNRKSSFELFGYDFMVDADYNTWLIEVNSSPDFSYSTPITKKLVKEASKSYVNIIVSEKFPRQKSRKIRKENHDDEILSDDNLSDEDCELDDELTDTGLWDCIYKGPKIRVIPHSMNHMLSCEGKKLPKKFFWRPKKKDDSNII